MDISKSLSHPFLSAQGKRFLEMGQVVIVARLALIGPSHVCTRTVLLRASAVGHSGVERASEAGGAAGLTLVSSRKIHWAALHLVLVCHSHAFSVFGAEF